MGIFEFMGNHPIVTVILAWLMVALIVDLAKIVAARKG